MKARIPKSYLNLPDKEKEVIARLVQEESAKAMDEQEVHLFVQFVKIACIVLHDYLEMDVSELITFIGDFKNFKRRYRNLENVNEFNAFLDTEMQRIFNGEFPIDFVEKLQRGN